MLWLHIYRLHSTISGRHITHTHTHTHTHRPFQMLPFQQLLVYESDQSRLQGDINVHEIKHYTRELQYTNSSSLEQFTLQLGTFLRSNVGCLPGLSKSTSGSLVIQPPMIDPPHQSLLIYYFMRCCLCRVVDDSIQAELLPLPAQLQAVRHDVILQVTGRRRRARGAHAIRASARAIARD